MSTHQMMIVGDGQLRGPDLGLMDPVLGLRMAVTLTSGTLEENAVLRGQTSTAVARITRIIDENSFYAEMVGSGTGTPPGTVGAAFAQNSPPIVGEVIDSDNGAVMSVSPFVGEQSYRGTDQYSAQQGDAEWNSFTPDDPSTDTPFWDARAKIASKIKLVGSSLNPAPPAVTFAKGDRCTTTSGGAFTVLRVTTDGTDFFLHIVRKSGTIAAGDVVTNTTRTGSADIVNDPAAVEPDWGVGAWVPHHHMPNLNGTGTDYELPPWGNGEGMGVHGPIVRGLWKKWKDDANPLERGVRVFAYRSFDFFDFDSATTALSGGVTVQRVNCSGTFPTNWQQHEEVTGPGGWSAKVWGFNEDEKWLYVYDTNGETLAAGTINGGTSGASSDATGPCVGWRKGSAFWNSLVSEHARSTAFDHPNSKGLYQGQAAQLEGIFLAIWESELAPFGPNAGAPVPTIDMMAEQWAALIGEIREHYSDDTLPIALMHFDVRSQAQGINIFGVPVAFLLREAMKRVALIPHVTLATTEGLQGWQSTPEPEASSILYLSPDSYPEIGRRAFRALTYGSAQIPTGDMGPLHLVLIAGQSFASSRIPPQWAFLDGDPDLFKSISFPGAQTGDPDILNFHTQALEWRAYDVEHCANTFLDETGFGFEAPILCRLAGRVPGEKIGLIKVARNGASANGQVNGAATTFDPAHAGQIAIPTTSCALTVVPGNSNNPARGRFTTAAGTFSNVQIGQFAAVSGSTLGFLGLGGNNTNDWDGKIIREVAVDGSYIEVEGAFVAETADFRIQVGAFPLMTLIEPIIKTAMQKAVSDLNLIPRSFSFFWWNGEQDTTDPAAYQAALQRVIVRFDELFGVRAFGESRVPTGIMEMTEKTPAPVPDENVEQIIAAQRAVAASIGNAVSIPTHDLPMELNAQGTWPRASRLDNGYHTTPQGYMKAGYRADLYISGLVGIPPHPEGENTDFEFGASGDGATGGTDTDASAESDAEAGDTDTIGEDDIGTQQPVDLPLIVEDGTGIENANSYLSVAEFRSMAIEAGNPTEISDATDEQVQTWLRLAGKWGVDYLFSNAWSGVRTWESQGMDWPRSGSGDNRTHTILDDNVIPRGVKEAQFWYAVGLALGIDPLRHFDVKDSESRKRLATSYSESLPGGLSESMTFGAGAPAHSVMFRSHLAAEPFLISGDDYAGIA